MGQRTKTSKLPAASTTNRLIASSLTVLISDRNQSCKPVSLHFLTMQFGKPVLDRRFATLGSTWNEIVAQEIQLDDEDEEFFE